MFRAMRRGLGSDGTCHCVEIRLVCEMLALARGCDGGGVGESGHTGLLLHHFLLGWNPLLQGWGSTAAVGLILPLEWEEAWHSSVCAECYAALLCSRARWQNVHRKEEKRNAGSDPTAVPLLAWQELFKSFFPRIL